MKQQYKKNIFQRFSMPLDELEIYYREQRKLHFEHKEPVHGIVWRKRLHPALKGLLRILHKLNKQTILILKDQYIPTNRPLIYACTHIGHDDIEIISTAVRKHSFLFWGDPRENYRRLPGFFLYLKGVICCDTAVKSDRKIGKETCIKLLRQGGDLQIFPEGAWNITENLPVLPLFPGTAEMAIQTGAEIVPIAIEQYENNFLLCIGKNIDGSRWDLSRKQELTDLLRDRLATLKWNIWESMPVTKRETIPDHYRDTFIKQIEEQTDDTYTIQDIRKACFHPKNITAPSDAFAHLSYLIPSRKNAFLLRN